MRAYLILFVVVLFGERTQAQRLYRFNDNGKTSTKEFDLIDTKLDLKFSFENQTVNGEAWIRLKPHFESTNKLQLDAKQMKVYEVKLAGKKVEYYNSGEHLNIDLPKFYSQKDTLNLYVKYKGNPNKIKNEGGVAITDNKGLYFINPLGADKNKPTQIWSQGEPEQNCAWFPTIDKPNQKSTQEITLTVPAKYKTLSNGKLISQTDNNDGTRTDFWKQELPHPPYLFFVGVGDFAVIKQEWRGKEVNFYVEPSYKDTASELFKNTTEMLTFFSDLTGVEYPWDKYSQIIVRDYVSGAMENTGAVVHAEQAMLSKGELSERNNWESTIAHEMFHHWFGDLVTTESWANITVNESFANYSEFLWFEHRYGADRAAEHLLKTKDAYLNKSVLQENYEKHLVRYNYSKKDDVFDVVSYNKGGMILHMLRNYLGDAKFFAGLHKYLKDNQFKSAEAHQLRVALEEVSGEDLTWFFSQWYYSNGHPRLKVTYEKDLITEKLKIKVTQLEKEFDFPLSIDVYYGKKGTQSLNVFMDEKEKTFEIPNDNEYKLIKINANHVLLAEIDTPELTTEELVFQYKNVPHYVDRLNALKALKDKQSEKEVFKVFESAFNDPYETIKAYALENINLSGKFGKKKVIKKIETLAESENPNISAAAISVLGKLGDFDYLPLFKKGVESISPKVQGSSLISIFYTDKSLVSGYVDKMSDKTKDRNHRTLMKIYFLEKNGIKENQSFLAKYVLKGMMLTNYVDLRKDSEKAFKVIARTNDENTLKIMADDFVSMGLKYKKYKLDEVCINLLKYVVKEQNDAKHLNKDKLLMIAENALKSLVLH